jgi:soluble lytic murein transglycosylase-like protein
MARSRRSSTRSHRAVRSRRTQLAALLLIAAACVLFAALRGGEQAPRRLSPFSGDGGAKLDPLDYRPELRARFEARGGAGLAQPLYAKSIGGALAAARRTARYRPLVERAAAARGLNADDLEAIVFLESSGRPDARASNDLNGAAGLTQILAETGRHLLGLHVDVGRSTRLTRGIDRGRHVAAREAARRRADERFDPAKALAAAARYLRIARDALHRDDLALVSYHMGIGNVQGALRAYGEGDVPYAQLFFDSSPLHHAGAWAKLASLGDDSSTYLWRLRAARHIMALYRSNPARLSALAVAHRAKPDAEAVLHPASTTPVLADPEAVRAARSSGELVPLPVGRLARHGIAVDPRMGELAGRLHEPPSLYRALRPEALAMLEYIGTAVRDIARGGSLTVSSAVRDGRYQGLLPGADGEATDGYSLHTTGWAFDVARRYRSREQALAFQFVLDRLTALNLVAWVREPTAIHVTVGAAPAL